MQLEALPAPIPFLNALPRVKFITHTLFYHSDGGFRFSYLTQMIRRVTIFLLLYVFSQVSTDFD